MLASFLVSTPPVLFWGKKNYKMQKKAVEWKLGIRMHNMRQTCHVVIIVQLHSNMKGMEGS